MKKITLSGLFLIFITCLTLSCTKSEFAKDYQDPSKVNQTQIGQQYTGALQVMLPNLVPTYYTYFVVEQPWMAPFTQSIGKVNTTGMYKVGSQASDTWWDTYYNFLSQFREFQSVYNTLSPSEQAENRIYDITANIFMYDQTEQMIDLYNDIPWSQAGYVAQYGNDYQKSLAKFDSAESLYALMLDSLKVYANELDTIQVPTSVQLQFRNQDFINFGSIDLWKRYCNSLRLRMLTRVSEVPSFQERYTEEIQNILNNPDKYPLVSSNDKNIQVNVINITGAINSDGWNQGIGSSGWNLDIASKSMIDFMNTNNDPRRRVLFEKNADGVYAGLDDSWTSSQQNDSINAGKISIYNQTTFDDNQYYPGVMITASEVNFDLAEYFLRKDGFQSSIAKSYYDSGIAESIDFHFAMQALSQNNSRGGTAAPLTPMEISNYLTEKGVDWDNAADDSDALKLIAEQRWVHFNIVQNLQNWSAYRRTGLPILTFPIDNSSTQQQPPVRFPYGSTESSLNAQNYAQVAKEDNLNSKIFWAVH